MYRESNHANWLPSDNTGTLSSGTKGCIVVMFALLSTWILSVQTCPPAFADCPTVEQTCPEPDLPEGFEPYEWALGFGKNTKGAETYNGYKSFDTYYVTETTDYGPSPAEPVEHTLRYAIEEVAKNGPTLILFSVGGEDIVLDRPLRLQARAYVTMDGSDDSGAADGLGASITGDEFSLYDCHDVVIRYLRFRSGVNTGGRYHCNRSLLVYGSAVDDPVYGDWSHDVLIDHCSIEDSRDDNLNFWGACCRLTVQNCIIGGSVLRGGKAGLIAHSYDTDEYATVCNNIITDTFARLVDFGTTGRVDFYNNVIGNYYFPTRLSSDDDYHGPRINIMNNYYRGFDGIYIDPCLGAPRPQFDPVYADIGTSSCNHGGLPSCPQLMNNDCNYQSVYIAGNYYEYWNSLYNDFTVYGGSQWGLTGSYTTCSSQVSVTTDWSTNFQKGSAHTTDASPESATDAYTDLVTNEGAGCLLPLSSPGWDGRDQDLVDALDAGVALFPSISASLDGVPGAASNPSPADTATGVARGTGLSWTAGDETEKYDVYFRVSGGSYSLISADQTGTSYTFESRLAANTTYNWYVVSKNTCYTTEGDKWSFTTGS